MSDKLFPMLYKPGIKKDGTKFQSEYCTDGNWIRFQNGAVKKMGGIKSFNFVEAIDLNASAIRIIPHNGNMYVYLASTTKIKSFILDANFELVSDQHDILPNAAIPALFNRPALLWQTEIVINKANSTTYVAFLGTNNGKDIFDNTQGALYYIPVNTAVNNGNDAAASNVKVATIPAVLNGGMVFAAPYLFLYGSGGLIQWSSTIDPFDFTIAAANNPLPANATAAQIAARNALGSSLVISNDKVIHGKEVRGGINTPAILFWTTTSLIMVKNVSEGVITTFKHEKISEITIISSKCVVEHDGLFYWVGTDKMYVYNGVSQRLVNTINMRDFYEKVDLSNRQLIFGVRNDRDEIRWSFPMKSTLQPDGTNINTAEIVYNIRENTWFDTTAKFSAAFFSKELGILATYGKPVDDSVFSNQYYLWLNEYGIDQMRYNTATNAYITTPIDSSFTTPVFSWTAFSPLKEMIGLDRKIILKRIEPDVKSGGFYTMNVRVNTKLYAQSPVVISIPYSFSHTTSKIDLLEQGRHMTLTFSSQYDFEIGHFMLLCSVGDGQ